MISAEPPIPTDLTSLLVFGGSFDPPHRAHVTLAREAALRSGCAHVLLVPANRSPHKDRSGATPAQRYEMVRHAIAGDAMFSVSRIEIDRPPPSFTVHTLEQLRTHLSADVRVRLLMGSDQARSFHRWFHPDRILELAEPLVLMRPPHTVDDLPEGWQDRVVDLPLDTVSSTEVRRRLVAGEDCADLIAPSVLTYIRTNHLYES